MKRCSCRYHSLLTHISQDQLLCFCCWGGPSNGVVCRCLAIVRIFACPRYRLVWDLALCLRQVFRLPQRKFKPILDRFLIEVSTLPEPSQAEEGSPRAVQHQQITLKAVLVSSALLSVNASNATEWRTRTS